MARPGRWLSTLCAAWLCASSARAGAATACEPPTLAQHVASDAARTASTDALAIGSFNIHGGHRIADPLVAWIQSRSLDVVVLQEVGYQTVDGGALAAELADRLGFSFAYAPTLYREGGVTQGLAMLSRYPLDEIRVESLAEHNLRFRSRCRASLTATVLTGAGEVRVVDLHLDTRINSEDRVAQLTPILERLRADGGPQIVAGDFNTITVGWWQSTVPLPFAQHQGAAVRKAMTAEGFVTPFGENRATLKLAGLPMRLDWIFVKRLTALDWGVDDVPFSDHRAVWARVAVAGSK